MPGYCKEALVRFNHKLRPPTDQPHKHVPPRYGAKIQYATKEDLAPKVDEEKTKFIQQVTGNFQYYARAVDPTMLVALGAIAADQSAPTERTYEKNAVLPGLCSVTPRCHYLIQKEQHGSGGS